jgi:glycosyltransferase involved in cell wall biosynthesis
MPAGTALTDSRRSSLVDLADRRVTVVLVHWDAAQRSGPSRFLERLVHGIDRSRFRPIVVFLRPGPLVAELREAGVQVELLPAGRARHAHRLLYVLIRLLALCRKEHATLLFGNGAKEHLYAGGAALLGRLPSVWCSHNVWNPADRVNRVVARLPVSAILANSRYTRSILPAPLQRRCRVVEFGVEPVTPDAVLAAAARRFRDPAGDGPVVSTVGVLAPAKGQEYLVRAAPAILARFPTARFLIAGGPTAPPYERNEAYARHLYDLAKRLGVRDQVDFLGDQKNVPAVLAASDVVVHPRVDAETFGFAIAEAMVAGKPVVASQLGAQKELIVDGETGILVPPADSAAIAAAVLALLADPERRQSMGRAARERALSRYTIDRMVHEIERLFLDVVSAAPGAAVPVTSRR